jgi:hypothetical protein
MSIISLEIVTREVVRGGSPSYSTANENYGKLETRDSSIAVILIGSQTKCCGVTWDRCALGAWSILGIFVRIAESNPFFRLP